MNEIVEGWRVSGLGLISVFAVLMLLYFIIAGLLRLFPDRPNREDEA
mgnify:CR=1 FL=1